MNRAAYLMACLWLAAGAWSAEPQPAAIPARTPVTATDYFNRGGAQFCRNQMDEAKKTVADGLAQYPVEIEGSAIQGPEVQAGRTEVQGRSIQGSAATTAAVKA